VSARESGSSRSPLDVVLGEGATVQRDSSSLRLHIGAYIAVGAFVEIQVATRRSASHCKISTHSFICSGSGSGTACLSVTAVTFVNDKHHARVQPRRDGPKGAGDWTLA